MSSLSTKPAVTTRHIKALLGWMVKHSNLRNHTAVFIGGFAWGGDNGYLGSNPRRKGQVHGADVVKEAHKLGYLDLGGPNGASYYINAKGRIFAASLHRPPATGAFLFKDPAPKRKRDHGQDYHPRLYLRKPWPCSIS